MKVQHHLIAAMIVGLATTSAFADTFHGRIVFKDADGALAGKSGEVELDSAQIDAIKLKIAGVDNIADKVRVKRMEGENRTVVLAVFRNVRDMPAGSAVIVKGNLLEGTNGGLFYGDVLTRTCEDQSKEVGVQDDGEDSYLDNMIDAVLQLQDKTGCASEYRGGLLVAHETDDGDQSQDK